MRRVGRSDKVNKKVLKETLIKYKKEIIKENFRVISKNHSIWIQTALELNNVMTPNVLYTFVTCNKFGIRDQLCDHSPMQYEDIRNEDREEDENADENEQENISKTKSTTMSDSSLNQSSVRFSNAGGVSTFIISVIPKEDYTSMIIHKKYRRAEKNRSVSTREYSVLKPGLWQHSLVEKI